MKAVHIIAFILLVIGGLNWLLFAFGWNLVSTIFGAGSMLANAVYILIGLSAIYEALMHGKNCKTCSAKM
jgi:uncharacterized membrane protein YuzA (DUF378 family)